MIGCHRTPRLVTTPHARRECGSSGTVFRRITMQVGHERKYNGFTAKQRSSLSFLSRLSPASTSVVLVLVTSIHQLCTMRMSSLPVAPPSTILLLEHRFAFFSPFSHSFALLFLPSLAPPVSLLLLFLSSSPLITHPHPTKSPTTSQHSSSKQNSIKAI